MKILRHDWLLPFALATLTAVAPLTAQGEGGASPGPRGPGRGRGPELPTLTHFTVETGTLHSDKVRGETEAGYFVFLPKGFADEANKDKQYPWVLWLPGFGGPNDFLRRGGAETLDRLRGDGVLPEMALVVYRAPGMGRRGSRSTYMNGEAAADTEDLLTQDLLAHLHEKYRLSEQRKDRAVMGCSAGGFGALKIALRHPDLFAAVAVHSAAILPADPAELEGQTQSMVERMVRGGLAEQLGDPIDKVKWQEHMPLGIVANRKPEDLHGLQIYFDAGTDDHYGFFEPNEKLDAAMTAHQHKHLFRPVEGGGHAWGSPTMKDNLAESLRFVALAFAGKDAVVELSKPATKDEVDAKPPVDHATEGHGK